MLMKPKPLEQMIFSFSTASVKFVEKKQGLYWLRKAIGTLHTPVTVASHRIRKLLVSSCILSEKIRLLFLSSIT